MKTEQRQEYRLQAEERVYLSLPIDEPGDDDPYAICICTSVDVSANGLQVVLGEALPSGHFYEICVDLKNPDQRFHLVVESKWFRNDGDNVLNGFTICEAAGKDTARWKAFIAEKLLTSLHPNL